MRIKIVDIRYFFLTWLSAIITIIVYYLTHIVPKDAALYAVIQSFFSSFTTSYVLYQIEKSTRNKGFSCAFVLLIVTILYNQNSISKFSVNSLFDGYITDNLIRILGNIYVDLIIIVATYLFIHYRRKDSNINFMDNNLISIPGWIMYIFVVFFAYVRLIYIPTSTLTRAQSTYVNAFYYIICAMAVMYFKKAKTNKKIVKAIPIVIIGLIQASIAFNTGAKASLIKCALIIGVGLFFVNELSFKYIKLATAISPIILQAITAITEFVSNRMQFFNSEWVMRYHAFRYDLSDFALTVATKANLKYAFGIIGDAIRFMIPGYSMQEKNNILYRGSYRLQLQEIGLSQFDFTGFSEDFNDTLFSIGAQLLGFAGMFLFFLFVLFLFDWFSKRLKKMTLGYMLTLVLIGPSALIDCDMLMFCYTIRDSFLIIFIAYIVFRIIRLLRKKKTYKRLT